MEEMAYYTYCALLATRGRYVLMPFWKKPKEQVKTQTTSDESTKLVRSLEENLETIMNVFKNDLDFSYRKFQLNQGQLVSAIYIDSLVDTEIINRDIIRPLQNTDLMASVGNEVQWLLDHVLYSSEGEIAEDMETIVDALLHGKTVLLVDGEVHSLVINTFKAEKRSIQQPETERVVRGARDGLIEQLSTNVSLLRYRLPVPEFRVEPMKIGKNTKTQVAICYIENIASDDLVKETKNRLKRINIDRILDAGYIEQFIQDNPRSPFPQVQNTERPDKAVGNLLEGRVVLIVDGSPFVLVVPATFNQF